VRLRPAGTLGFDALCAQAHSSIRKMLAYGRVPLEVLLRETALTPSGNTVFPIWAQFIEEGAVADYEVAGLRLSPVATKRRNLLAELDVDMLGSASDWRCEFAYRTSLFEDDFVQSMMLGYVDTLHQVLAHPRATVGELGARLS
jgi:non-ribosomal peptide synthetase component F